MVVSCLWAPGCLYLLLLCAQVASTSGTITLLPDTIDSKAKQPAQPPNMLVLANALSHSHPSLLEMPLLNRILDRRHASVSQTIARIMKASQSPTPKPLATSLLMVQQQADEQALLMVQATAAPSPPLLTKAEQSAMKILEAPSPKQIALKLLKPMARVTSPPTSSPAAKNLMSMIDTIKSKSKRTDLITGEYILSYSEVSPFHDHFSQPLPRSTILPSQKDRLKHQQRHPRAVTPLVEWQ